VSDTMIEGAPTHIHFTQTRTRHPHIQTCSHTRHVHAQGIFTHKACSHTSTQGMFTHKAPSHTRHVHTLTCLHTNMSTHKAFHTCNEACVPGMTNDEATEVSPVLRYMRARASVAPGAVMPRFKPCPSSTSCKEHGRDDCMG